MSQFAVGLREPANRVSPKARLLWTAESLLGNAVVLAILIGLAAWFRDRVHVPWWVWVLVAILCILEILIVPALQYRTHRWEANALAVYTQTGWLGRERRIAPMSRVQTVDFEQGAIARALGLAEVTVTTASAKGPIKIEGLAASDAERLVASLTEALESTDGDAT
ncbi:MAG: PH domain-containing protein [Nocardioidaceae bacterium]|nr:PH domain-containing protein [Nocardioidaceae bacterium]MCO5324074.1 PH domain-containing protein [Nocardioidaceae bacterium]